MDHVIADGLEVFESDLHGGDVEIIERAILERGGTFGAVELVALHRGDGDRPTREPGTAQFAEGFAPCDQRADAGRVTEHFVKGDRHKVRVDRGEVERVGGDKRGRVEQHVPAVGVRALDPFERMLDA